MRVLFLTRYDRRGASSRLRSLQYVPYLRKQNIEATVSPLLSDEYLKSLYGGHRSIKHVLDALVRRRSDLRVIENFDVLWVEKELFPWLPYCVERRVLRRGASIVADYDDAIFHNYDLNVSPFVRWSCGAKIAHLMAQADLVTVGNQYLRQYAEHAGAKWVELLPTVIDLDRYPLQLSERKAHQVTVGWIGTPITSSYLHLIRSALERACKDLGARAVLVGSGPIRLEGVPVEIHTWLEATEQEKVAGFDIGIMPLPDEPWERGKCGYKLIQYMACAKPVIASPVGVNREIVEHGRNGFLARTQDEWFEFLRMLITDTNLRNTMGAEGRKKVEQQFSVQVMAPMLAKWMRALVQPD